MPLLKMASMNVFMYPATVAVLLVISFNGCSLRSSSRLVRKMSESNQAYIKVDILTVYAIIAIIS